MSVSDGDNATAAQYNALLTMLGSGTPANCADYIVYKSDSTYYARNGRDGSIDATNASLHTVLQYCIDALTGGGRIYIQAGEYTLTQKVVLSYPVTIEGAGAGLSYSGDGVTEINFGNHTAFEVTSKGTAIRHMQIKGPGKTNGSAMGIKFDTTSADINQNETVEDVMLVDVYYGIFMTGTNQIWELRIKNVTVNYCNQGIHSSVTDRTNVFIEYCIIENTDSDGIYLTKVDGIGLRDVRVLACGQDGLNIPSFYGGAQVIHGCEFDNCARYGINIQFAASTMAYVEISDNWCHAKNNALIVTNCSGLGIHGGNYFLIAGGTPDSIIHLTGCDKVRMLGAQVRNSSGSAILEIELEDCVHSTLVGNYCQTATAHTYCIEESGSSDGNIFVANRCDGWSVAGVHIIGGNSIDEHNY